jgi:predicted DNA-binding protein
MHKEEAMKETTGIRWPDELKALIKQAAREDSRTFSDEVRELVKLGLKKRRRPAIASTVRDQGGRS